MEFPKFKLKIEDRNKQLSVREKLKRETRAITAAGLITLSALGVAIKNAITPEKQPTK